MYELYVRKIHFLRLQKICKLQNICMYDVCVRCIFAFFVLTENLQITFQNICMYDECVWCIFYAYGKNTSSKTYVYMMSAYDAFFTLTEKMQVPKHMYIDVCIWCIFYAHKKFAGSKTYVCMMCAYDAFLLPVPAIPHTVRHGLQLFFNKVVASTHVFNVYNTNITMSLCLSWASSILYFSTFSLRGIIMSLLDENMSLCLLLYSSWTILSSQMWPCFSGSRAHTFYSWSVQLELVNVSISHT